MYKLRIALLAIALTCFLAIIGVYAALMLFVSGTWPFSDLVTRTEYHHLSSGAKIKVVSIEDRGFGSDGFGNTAFYQESDSSGLEEIGGWQGHDTNVKSFVMGVEVVVLNPNQTTLHVRLIDGSWKFFYLSFPDSSSEFPLSHYVAMTGLGEADLKKIMNENVLRISPAAFTKSFSPDSRELLVHYLASADKQLYLRLRLSEDGQRLKLVEMRPKDN